MKILIKFIAIFFIFILGYICGDLGIDKIIKYLNISEINTIELIGSISSIITLVLFVAYIIGRCFMMREMKENILESFTLFYEDEKNEFRVVKEYDLGENTKENLYLKSLVTLRWIKIYECYYDEKSNKYIKRQLVVEHEFLKSGFAIKLNTYVPCGMPNYIIEYQKFDFMIGQLCLMNNGRSNIFEDKVEINYTMKSILYYLVK